MSGATCTEAGKTVYTATFKNPAFIKQEKTVAGESAKDHTWSEATYTWNADNTLCAAERTCFCGERESENGVISKVVSGATCTEAGKTVYTATFQNPAFIKQEKTVAGESAKDHTWSEATYTWNADNTVCTAERTCFCGERESENGVISKVVSGATCTEAGKTVYTATFQNPAFIKQEKTVAGESAKDHTWSEATYTWNTDNTVCTAERTCFCGERESENGTVTRKTAEDGSTVYTATFKNTAFAAQEKVVPGESAHQHSWSKATYIWSRDYTTCMALRTCSCAEKETETVTVTKVVTDATCTEAGSVVYTAVFTNSAFAAQEKRVAGEPAKGHSWSAPIYTWNEDRTACSAERTCVCGEKETETAGVTCVTTKPHCTEAGKRVCTADFTKDGFEDQTVEIVLDALGHDYQEIRDEDGKLICKCSICGEEDPDFDAGEEDDKGENNKKTVTFRLIGDFVHEDGVDDHEEYVTWIETTTYTIEDGDTVYDVFAEALKDAGMKSKGAVDGYVSAIRAPSGLGGYWLTELDNSPNAGWMYTVNGDHVSETLTEYELEDGDEILWHYVDDYTKEENPKSKYYERWLEADDISPEDYVKRRLKDIVEVEGKGEVEPKLKLSHIGEDVKFTFVPAEGWALQSVTIDGKAKGAIDSYTYKNLSLNSRIEVVFVKAEEVVPNVWFIDVAETDWFYDDVYFTVNNGLFNGVSDLYFEPAAAMTRGMLVTVLHRMEGTPAVTGGSAFTDVAAGQWYTDAVIWATRKGIVNGYGDGRFGPNDPITREQMAAILFRYAQNKGYDVTGRADLTAFTDYNVVSGYAMDAIAWANANGLIQGRTITTLVPAGTATRAEVAAILHRFLLNIVK